MWLFVASDTPNVPANPQPQLPYLNAGAYATELTPTEKGSDNVISLSANFNLVSRSLAWAIVCGRHPTRCPIINIPVIRWL
jgi:hypothetical protein